jgi:adenine-specific DNA-methyltransferase
MGRINFNEYGVSFKGIMDNATTVLNTTIPIIKSDDDKVKNLIIEGENLHSLIALMPEYKGKIKFIPIDVPYFTGNNDFYYNDKFINTEDSDANSKYCSFLYPRILMGRELLSEEGVMGVFCDTNQMFNIRTKVLDPIFGEENFINMITLQGNPGGRSDASHIATTSEYLLLYSKNKKYTTSFGIPSNENGKEVWSSLRKSGSNDLWSDRKDMFFPFVVNRDNVVELLEKEDYLSFTNGVKLLGINFLNSNEYKKIIEKYMNQHKKLVLPKAKKAGYYSIWKWSACEKCKVHENLHKLRFVDNNGEYDIQSLTIKSPTTTLKDNLSQSQYDGKKFTNTNAKSNLSKRVQKYFNIDDSEVKKHIVGSTPKNEYMMRDIIWNFTTEGDIILDCFGGTMMTYVGVMLANQLNDENREFIGITNNEGDHFNSLSLPNVIESEKEILGYKNHTICKIELLQANTEEDKFELFFYNDKNIFSNFTEHYSQFKHNILKNSIDMIINIFK